MAPDLDMTHLERCIYLVSLRPKKQMLVDDSPISCVTLFVFGTVSVMPSLSETSQRPKLPERCKRKGSQDSQCNSFRIVNRWLLIVFCLCVYVIVCSVLRLILDIQRGAGVGWTSWRPHPWSCCYIGYTVQAFRLEQASLFTSKSNQQQFPEALQYYILLKMVSILVMVFMNSWLFL